MTNFHLNDNQNKLVHDQRTADDQIIRSMDIGVGGLFFLEAPGGTGKTFLINLVLDKVRYNKCIAIAVASSGIAATLLTGGRTAHSSYY